MGKNLPRCCAYALIGEHRQEDPVGCALVDSLSSVLEEKYGKPIGFTSVPLETRFTVIRTQESNFGNFT